MHRNHSLLKHELFLNGAHHRLRFDCAFDNSGLNVGSLPITKIMKDNLIVSNHLDQALFSNANETVGMFGFKFHPWKNSTCERNHFDLLVLPDKHRTYLRERTQTFYWVLVYICLSLLCSTQTGISPPGTQQVLTKKTWKVIDQYLKRSTRVKEAKLDESNPLSIMDTLIFKQRREKFVQLVFNSVICVGDIVLLVLIYTSLPKLTDESVQLSNEYKNMAGCVSTFSHTLLEQASLLEKPVQLKGSVYVCWWIILVLRLGILAWTIAGWWLDNPKIRETKHKIDVKIGKPGFCQRITNSAKNLFVDEYKGEGDAQPDQLSAIDRATGTNSPVRDGENPPGKAQDKISVVNKNNRKNRRSPPDQSQDNGMASLGSSARRLRLDTPPGKDSEPGERNASRQSALDKSKDIRDPIGPDAEADGLLSPSRNQSINRSRHSQPEPVEGEDASPEPAVEERQ